MQKISVLFGLGYSALAVALGAFGAHAIRSRVTPALLATWETAVQYHFLHALALVGLGLWMRQYQTSNAVSLWCFVLGIGIFSGSLYALVLTEQRWLGAITPIGGVLFVVGWLWWLIVAVRMPD